MNIQLTRQQVRLIVGALEDYAEGQTERADAWNEGSDRYGHHTENAEAAAATVAVLELALEADYAS